MNAQYDTIAEQYARTKQSPLRTWVERPSFMRLAGQVDNLRVLDLACGDGFYTRLLKAAGAGEIVGVDISPAMIARAERYEQNSPAGIRYVCADAANLPDLGSFDLVTAAYLLHYAVNDKALVAMCTGIARALTAGGRFVTLNENPEYPAEPNGAYAQYGFSKTIDGDPVDGATIRYRMLAGRESFGFEARYYARASYDTVLRQTGFTAVQWHDLILDREGAEAMGTEYFEAYLAHPPVVGLSCCRR